MRKSLERKNDNSIADRFEVWNGNDASTFFLEFRLNEGPNKKKKIPINKNQSQPDALDLMLSR